MARLPANAGVLNDEDGFLTFAMRANPEIL